MKKYFDVVKTFFINFIKGFINMGKTIKTVSDDIKEVVTNVNAEKELTKLEVEKKLIESGEKVARTLHQDIKDVISTIHQDIRNIVFLPIKSKKNRMFTFMVLIGCSGGLLLYNYYDDKEGDSKCQN